MNGLDLVSILLSKGHDGILALYPVDKSTFAQYHPLVDQLFGGLIHREIPAVVHELGPESAVEQVAGGMFTSTQVKVHVLPVVERLLRGELLRIRGVHIAEHIATAPRPTGHGVQLQGKYGLMIYGFIRHHFIGLGVPGPYCGATQRRITVFRGQVLLYFGQTQR